MRPKALPWAVMVSIDTDVDSACPSSAESVLGLCGVAALWGLLSSSYPQTHPSCCPRPCARCCGVQLSATPGRGRSWWGTEQDAARQAKLAPPQEAWPSLAHLHR